jgi:glutathione synthase/RimK-type ligase-like ATP-grasp enzyme
MTKKYRYVKTRTRNHTASPLRNTIPSNGYPVIFRMGSQTPTQEVFPEEQVNNVFEINTAEACANSGDKLIMKRHFLANNVKTANFMSLTDFLGASAYEIELRYPLIIKHRNSSKGRGIYYIKDIDDIRIFNGTHQHHENYIIENYHQYSKEYRLHVTKDGCFYACRKMLKSGAVNRWHRHDSNSVWIMEDNPMFDKPSNWDEIIEHSVKALTAVGLTIGAVDVKCTSSKSKKQDFIILETNSAPSFGVITLQKYIIELNKIIENESFRRMR